MLHLISVTKAYSDRMLFDIPDVKIGSGLYWIQGENGTGKTTLLKILAGIIPYSGKIVLKGVGEEKLHRSAYRKYVNFAEAEPNFPNFLSGKDLIRFYEKAKGMNATYPNLSSLFELEQYSGKLLRTYSSGMLKKLSLVLGLIGKPKVILFDEPLITLDTRAVSSFLQILLEFRIENPDSLVLFSSHQAPNLDEIPLEGIFRMEHQTFYRLSP